MIKQLFRDIVWKMYCLYRFLVTTVFVGNLIFLPVLLCAPSVIYVHTEPIILSSCSNKSAFAAAPLYQPGMVDSFCFQQRRALFLFAVFNVVRILSFKFESMWLRSFKTCGVRQLLPGKYLNGALAVPFVTRELCEPYVHGYGAHFIFMFTNGVCSLLLIAPYIRDLIALIKLTLNGTGNEFYKTKAHLLLTVLAIICFLLTLIANVIDIAFGPYCPTTILGYSVLFPHLNFPLFLFALHHFILRTHKEHGRDIYEVCQFP
ncbi:unnamed protein product [Toxocara canis]|uniref:Serpentine receptor class gamma n=1 Tax=Toxocara canis TaxID=6265 RepID=A0A183V0A6_TOXCA|nr:unnamed protein product [Toxocara canis]